MRVFIANFGFENYLWPTCLARPSVATLEDEDLRAFSLARDREGYVARCLAGKTTRTGIKPPASVASRWFNLSEIVSDDAGTMITGSSREDASFGGRHVEGGGRRTRSSKPASQGDDTRRLTRCSRLAKGADAWSKTKNGKGYACPVGGASHAKARAFRFSAEGTLQQLRPTTTPSMRWP